MSSDIIIILAVGGIVAVFIILYVINSIEKARTRKAIRSTELQNRIMRLHELLEGIPPSVLSHQIKMAGYTEILSHYLQLKKLDPKTNKFDRKIEEGRATLEAISKEPAKKLKLDPIQTAEDLKETRKKLTALFTFIQNSVKTGTLTSQVAKQEMDTLKQIFTETGAQFYLAQAEREYQQKKVRIALHHYKMAASEFKKANNPSLYGQQIQSINAKVEQLEKEELESRRLKTKSNQSNPLTNGVEQIEDTSWHKKKF